MCTRLIVGFAHAFFVARVLVFFLVICKQNKKGGKNEK
jgi:hypothetical protein